MTTGIFKVQYKSVLSGEWVNSHLPPFSTERRAIGAATRAHAGYEVRVITA